MAETSTKAKKPVKRRVTRSDSEGPKPLCHIHDRVRDSAIESIHRKVCVNDIALIEHDDGHHYCIFHLPTADKDLKLFEVKFRTRLAEVEKLVDNATALSEKEQKTAIGKVRYDFSFVWFPSALDLEGCVFSASTNFSSATFSGDVNFTEATFSTYTNFSSATFSASAKFDSATFSASANFRLAKFSADANFSSATFSAPASFSSAEFSATDFRSARFSASAEFGYVTFSASVDFSWATFSAFLDFSGAIFSAAVEFHSSTFSADAYFLSTTFFGSASFLSTQFGNTSQVFFEETYFHSNVDFGLAVMKGYVHFEAGKGSFFDGDWIDEAKTTPKKVERVTTVFEGELDFEQLRAERPERITFNKTRLRPGWFVNVDSRKFVFTDIKWENHKASKRELENELASLAEREVEPPHNIELLTVAFRNLAANAEEFNRLEEASHFRKSSFECERLLRKHQRKQDWQKLRDMWEKDILGRRFFFELWKSLAGSAQILGSVRTDLVHSLYRLLSNFGESWIRAFFWLFVIWLVFAAAYYFVGGFGDSGEKGLEFSRSFGYSLSVMTLQKPEPRPYAWFTTILYGLETAVAAIQAALVALAIRRKFMR